MVVEARCGKNQVECGRNVRRLDILAFFDGLPIRILFVEIVERQVAITEVHGRGDAELKVSTQSEFAQHAHRQTCVPPVLIGRNECFARRAILVSDVLCTNVVELNVLKMSAQQHAKMERAQVGIRPILHPSVGLCIGNYRA